MMKGFRVAACFLFSWLAVPPAADGQSVTGQVSGRVTDSTGAILVGAPVKLTHDLSKQVREFTTDANGAFVFVALVPGAYTLNIAQPGFKAYEQKGLNVAAQERLDLSEIRLEVGELSTSVEVIARSVNVATDSSDRSHSIGLSQIADIATRGRNPLNLIIALPGVQTFVEPVQDYRFALILRGEGLSGEIHDTDPQRTGAAPLPAVAYSPAAERTAQLFNRWIAEAARILTPHPPANMLTLRGFAMDPSLPKFPAVYKMRSAAVAVYPMYKGVARLVGMDIVPVEARGGSQ